MKSLIKIIKPLVDRLVSIKIRLPFLLLIALLVASSALTIGIIKKQPESFGLLKGFSMIQKEEQRLVKRVAVHIDLPVDEQPTIATVTDKSQLEDQAFFQKSETGDKVLIYTNSGRVILYRPSEDRVVEVGNVNINNQGGGDVLENMIEPNAAGDGLVDKESQKGFIAIVANGTKKSGVVQGIADSVEDKVANIEVVDMVVAASSEYKQTLVIDVKGDKEKVTRELAEALGMVVSELPENEAGLVEASQADFLIIIGADFVEEAETIILQTEE